MVSRQETARALLTPGEIMQLPADDEIVMVSGQPPIRAKKLRYFEDPSFAKRVLPAPVLREDGYPDLPAARADDWSGRPIPPTPSEALDKVKACVSEIGPVSINPAG